MVRKLFRSTALMLVPAFAAMASVPVLAGQVARKVEPQQKALVPAVRNVHLRCAAEKTTKKEIVLNIVNNTPGTLPRGTKIYWEITQKVKGSFVLDASLAPSKPLRRSVKPTPPGSEFAFNPQPEPPGPPKAWFEHKVLEAR